MKSTWIWQHRLISCLALAVSGVLSTALAGMLREQAGTTLTTIALSCVLLPLALITTINRALTMAHHYPPLTKEYHAYRT